MKLQKLLAHSEPRPFRDPLSLVGNPSIFLPHSITIIVMLYYLSVSFCLSVSAAAAQGVPQGRSQCDSDLHLLLQRGQTGAEWQCHRHHRQYKTFPVKHYTVNITWWILSSCKSALVWSRGPRSTRQHVTWPGRSPMRVMRWSLGVCPRLPVMWRLTVKPKSRPSLRNRWMISWRRTLISLLQRYDHRLYE